jgi:N6-L-threonylcarbamoyladenine synthase
MKDKDVIILGIETSCDETSAAIVKDGRYVLSNVISSQIDIHKNFGGVVPEIAARKHIDVISQVIDEAINNAGLSFKNIDAIAVTYGPGLIGSLLTGVCYAKALAFALEKKLIAVNHIAGHICANYLENDFKPPFICCVISGGHTNTVYVSDYNKFKVIGSTLDDAVGETYDKIARVLGLNYPGGPEIEKIASLGDEFYVKFPKPMINDGFNFSFSGLKSSVIDFAASSNLNSNLQQDESKIKLRNNIAASFQNAVGEVIVKKTILACESELCNSVALCGGVASNSYLRNRLYCKCKDNRYTFNVPAKIFCTDNAAMIASSGYFKYLVGDFADVDLNATPNLKLTNE